MRTAEDLTGKQFGYWTVLRRVRVDKRKEIVWECRCRCGQTKQVYGGHLRQGNSKSCGCNIPKGRRHKQWRGHGDISGGYWDYIKGCATGKGTNRRVLEFEITIEEAWAKFLAQNKTCALTGLPLIINHARKTGPVHTASLDRIDNAKGYTKDNIQWVHKDVNMMKRIYDQDYFIDMCKLIAKHNK